MAIKKTELYNSLWRSCDELRGGMDASQYKDYILVLLFVKYVSDKWAGKMDAPVVVPEVGPGGLARDSEERYSERFRVAAQARERDFIG
ncbi:MAG: type I restriction-modification system subunit M N-terminal domain-containing protein [Rectinemataceae bacterium]